MLDPRASWERLCSTLASRVAGVPTTVWETRDEHAFDEPVRGKHASEPAPLGLPLRAVVVLALVAALVGLVLYLRGRPAPVDATPVASLGEPATATVIPTSAPASTPAGSIVVHVVGRVKKPGLVRLPAGARVADAVREAGGLTAHTNAASINLARVVSDGEQIVIGNGPAANANGVGADSVPSLSGGAVGPVDLNNATVEQLDALPGVGPVLAQRIIDFRTSKGRFASVDDLQQVDGIGAKKFADLRDRVRV